MGRVVAHVFVDDLNHLELRQRDQQHLAKALRLRPGETVTACDGRGGSLACQWSGSALTPARGAALRREPRPEPLITVGFALTKGDHPELAVQQLTEAGADRAVVLSTARCVARWAPSTVPRQLERLAEVARQAAMQSRRSWLPVVQGPLLLADLVATAGQAGLALAEPGGAPLSLTTPTVLIGPEGGWTEEELASVPYHVGLGPHVLRAGTAALAAGVLLAALRARLTVSAAGP